MTLALPLSGSQDTAPAEPHVAAIMDGNGRWARARGLAREAGHRAGSEAVRRTVEAAADPASGIGWLTLYAFSADNWRRPPHEVAALLGLFGEYPARRDGPMPGERHPSDRHRKADRLDESLRGADRGVRGGDARREPACACGSRSTTRPATRSCVRVAAFPRPTERSRASAFRGASAPTPRRPTWTSSSARAASAG
jgi:hypothetical protein